MLDGVTGQGHYVGTYIAWGQQYGWWGEGEIKFYLDGDREWPTICGTGTEITLAVPGGPFPGRGVRGVHHAVPRNAPSDRAGGREPDPAAFGLYRAGTCSIPSGSSKTCA